jgi:DNA repair protein RadA/Sms
MKSEKVKYLCSECGFVQLKWSGQCESCKEWNTLKEFKEVKIDKNNNKNLAYKIDNKQVKKLSLPTKNSKNNNLRISTDIKEYDRVLGGGFFNGSITLLTGDPGVGKSTLSLHLAINIAKKIYPKKVIIISGEESEFQISDRLFRIEKNTPKNLFLLSENILESALDLIKIEETGFVFFDSVQTISSQDIISVSGSMTQSVGVTERIMHFSKKNHIPTLLIGHVTKTGEMAGPQTMAHLVDTILYLEGDKTSEYRLLKSKKNRFGSISEVGVFEMEESGLKEVQNPSKNFLFGRLKNSIGSSVFAGIEGSRAFLIEVQSLTKYTNFGYPNRSTSGFDKNRLSILLAVLAKFTNIKLDNEDVFINIVGGLKIIERASDLAIIASLISSKKKIPLPDNVVFFGEVGLSGEIRNCIYSKKRVEESIKLNFTTIVSPLKIVKNIDCKYVYIRTIIDLENWIESLNNNR